MRRTATLRTGLINDKANLTALINAVLPRGAHPLVSGSAVSMLCIRRSYARPEDRHAAQVVRVLDNVEERKTAPGAVPVPCCVSRFSLRA
jgi:hypothetical protein